MERRNVNIRSLIVSHSDCVKRFVDVGGDVLGFFSSYCVCTLNILVNLYRAAQRLPCFPVRWKINTCHTSNHARTEARRT